jgi:hypothetical protein
LIHHKAESRTPLKMDMATKDVAWWDAAKRRSDGRSSYRSQAAEGAMTNNRVFLPALSCSTLLAVFALGLASAAQAQAQAQNDQDKPAAASEPGAAASKPGSVEGVTVNAPPPLAARLGVPPEKAAEYAAEAAQNKAWSDYRKSTPPVTSDPNDQSKDYPGLQTYIPK